jgi:hypothetical protein
MTVPETTSRCRLKFHCSIEGTLLSLNWGNSAAINAGLSPANGRGNAGVLEDSQTYHGGIWTEEK